MDRYKKFDEYIVHEKPDRKEKTDAYQPTIGLQDVDGHKVLNNLLEYINKK